MSESLFTSQLPFEPERVGAVAVYCSDGRFGDQVDEFLHRRLGLANYDRLAIPGGPAWLCVCGGATLLQYSLIHDQLDLLVQVHKLRRVVLIAHYGCAYYLHQHGGHAEGNLARQYTDLHEAVRALQSWYPSIQAEAYMARVQDGRVTFLSAR